MKQRHFWMFWAALWACLPVLAVEYSGKCGENVTYRLDTETGVLSVSGTGDISLVDGQTQAPWYGQRASVKSVVVGDGVGFPRYDWLNGCDSIEEPVYNSSTFYYLPRTFFYYHEVEYDFLPEGRKHIAPYACANVKGLEKLVIPEGYETVGDQAFYNCTSLGTAVLPESMKVLGYAAFQGCGSLYAINIPDALEDAGFNCFLGCNHIEKPLYNDKCFFYCPSEMTGEYTIPGSPQRINKMAFYESRLSTVHIPSSVKVIEESAFLQSYGLTSIELPSGLDSIGMNAFDFCGNLETIAIPDNVSYIGTNTFRGCPKLQSAVLPQGMRCIPAGIFDGCSELRDVELPERLDSIGAYAFHGTGLVSLSPLPEGLKYIGEAAFSECRALKEINLPETVDSIGYKAFYYCNSIQEPLYNSKYFVRLPNIRGEYTVPDGIRKIADYAFFSCDTVTAIYLPASVEEIGEAAFLWCTSLEKVGLPDGITEIKDFTFQTCVSLYSLSLPESVVSIGNRAFAACSKLPSVELPEGLVRIGDEAFYSCTGMEDVVIPAKVDYLGDRAFGGCTGLTSVTVDEEQIDTVGVDVFADCPNLKNITSFGGTYYSCPQDVVNCVVPQGIERIADRAFAGRTKLESVQLPRGVRAIGDEAFSDCPLLKTVVLPDTLEEQGGGMFKNCTALEEIDYPYIGVGRLAEETFKGCVNLKAVHLKEGLVKIDPNAFEGCVGLSSLELPNTVREIQVDAFKDCSGLTHIKLSAALDYFDSDAFYGCLNLESVEMDEANPDYASYRGILYNKEKTYVSYIPQGIKEISIPATFTDMSYSISFTESFFKKYPKVYSLELPFIGASKDGDYGYKSFLGYVFERDMSRDTTYSETSLGVTHTYELNAYTLPENIKKLTLYCDTLYREQMDYVVSESDYNPYLPKTEKNVTFLAHLDTLVIHATTDIDADVLNGRCEGLKVLVLDKANKLPSLTFEGMDNLQSLTVGQVGTMDFGCLSNLVGLKELNLPFAGAGSASTAANFGELFGMIPDDAKRRVVQFKEDGSSETYYVSAGLEKLVLSEGLETLPYGAFYNCSMLKELVLPSSLYMVGERALYGCAGLTDIYCKGAEPSSAYSNTFEGVRVNSCKLHVPYNSSDMYRRSTGWKDFYYIEEEAPVVISVVKNIENAGVIYGLQEYQPGAVAELKAVAHSGYTFSGWTEGGEVVSTDATYTFTVESDRSLIAVFTPVSGSNEIATVPESTKVSFTWEAEEGASTYRLDVYEDEAMTKLAGTLVFDAEGNVVEKRAATRLTATIDGLTASTDYYYRMTVYGETEQVISQYTGTFSTTEADAIMGSVAEEMSVAAVPGGIVVRHAPEGVVRVFAISGACVATRMSEGSSNLSVDLDKGFYVVVAGGKSCKVMVR